MKRLTVEGALETIINEGRRERLTKIGLQRIRAAGSALALNGREHQHLEMVLEYRNRDGRLHSWLMRNSRKNLNDGDS